MKTRIALIACIAMLLPLSCNKAVESPVQGPAEKFDNLLNQEGYADPTAHDAVANVTKEEELKRIRIRDEEITLFIKTIKRLAKSQHLRILNRIELLDMETGKKYL